MLDSLYRRNVSDIWASFESHNIGANFHLSSVKVSVLKKWRIYDKLWNIHICAWSQLQKSSLSRILLHSFKTSNRLAPRWNSSPKLHMSNNFLLCFWSRLRQIRCTSDSRRNRLREQWLKATRPWLCLRKFSMKEWRWLQTKSIRCLWGRRHNYIPCVSNKIPSG